MDEENELNRSKAYNILNAQRKFRQAIALQKIIGQTLVGWDVDRGGESDLNAMELAEAVYNVVEKYLEHRMGEQ